MHREPSIDLRHRGESIRSAGYFQRSGAAATHENKTHDQEPAHAVPGDGSEVTVGAEQPHAIGRYRILERIGAGGMGVVYRAEHEQLHHSVALKVIRPDLLSERAVHRFEFEAEILARLQHPGIAQIHEAGMFDAGDGPQPYFAMEFIDGEPITRFAQARALSVNHRLRLIAEVCGAVQHAHQRGVIHRDLKPKNILVDASGRPCVLDFGVAHATDLDLTLTRGGSASHADGFQRLAGTLPYMSPEQLADDAPEPDTRTDVYSLGVIAYELLTTRLPIAIDSASLFRAAEAIRTVDPPAAGSINPALRGDIDIILRTALEKDPAQRYQSPADLAADIQRFLSHEPIKARPPSRAYRMRKFARRNRTLVAGVAATFLVLAAGIAATSWQAAAARRAGATAEGRLEILRDHAAAVIEQLQAAIAELPESTPARARLAEASAAFLERVEADVTDDVDSLVRFALMRRTVGKLQADLRTASVGAPARGLAHQRRALELLQRAAMLEPVNERVLLELGMQYSCVSDSYRYAGDAVLAAEHMLLAAEVFAPLCEAGNAHACSSGLDRLRQRCTMLAEAGGNDPDPQRMTALMHKFRSSSGTFAGAWSPLERARIRYEAAYLLFELGRWREALDEADEALVLVDRDPHVRGDEGTYISEIAFVEKLRCRALEQLGDLPAALAAATRARAIYDRMLELRPAHEAAEYFLIECLGHESRLMLAIDDRAQAFEASRRAAAIGDRMHHRDTTNRRNRYIAADAWMGHLESCLALLEQVTDDDADVSLRAAALAGAGEALMRIDHINDLPRAADDPGAFTRPLAEQHAKALADFRGRLAKLEAATP
jgi:tetratricopeptide (TPR) repeat protein/predicted Ser/Thr protein kinase